MGAKQIIFDQEAREAIRVGIRTLAKAVKVTLGPRGRKVILEKSFGSPTITKDGVTVAKEVELEDKYADLGARMVKEVASKTNDAAGDGTTTATILAESLFEEGLRHAVAGVNPVSIKNGIEKAVEAIVAELQKMAIKVKDSRDISNVASVAANHDRSIGDYIAQAMDKVGKDGVITIEEGKSSDTSVELVEGMQFDRGYQSPYFVTNPGDMEAVLEDAFVLIHEKKISSIQDMVPLLEKVAQSGKPLLIISEEVEGEALATLVLNKMRGTLKVCAVKAPGYGDRRKEMLGDIAVLTGGKSIMEDLGIKLDSIQVSDLGRVKKAVVDKDNCTLVEGAGKTADIKARISQLRNQIEATTSDYDKEKLEERLAKLAGGVAQINVGAATESEMKEKKYRVEDALNAARAAVEEGILPGGGTALIRAAQVLDKVKASDDEKIGIDIVRRAVEAPLRTLADNAGVEGAVAVSKVKEFVKENKKDWGFNALTNEYSDLMKDGVFDTTKVVRLALTNAASIAGLLLTTDAVITELPKKEAAPAAPSPEDMY